MDNDPKHTLGYATDHVRENAVAWWNSSQIST